MASVLIPGVTSELQASGQVSKNTAPPPSQHCYKQPEPPCSSHVSPQGRGRGPKCDCTASLLTLTAVDGKEVTATRLPCVCTLPLFQALAKVSDMVDPRHPRHWLFLVVSFL